MTYELPFTWQNRDVIKIQVKELQNKVIHVSIASK